MASLAGWLAGRSPARAARAGGVFTLGCLVRHCRNGTPIRSTLHCDNSSDARETLTVSLLTTHCAPSLIAVLRYGLSVMGKEFKRLRSILGVGKEPKRRVASGCMYHHREVSGRLCARGRYDRSLDRVDARNAYRET